MPLTIDTSKWPNGTMFIYDSTSIAFIKKSETFLREILVACGIEVKRNRFLVNKYLYPIHIVIFEGSELAHFNAAYLQIALNKNLIYKAKESVLRDILKHELAHYLAHIHYGLIPSHGKEFHEICSRFGFPKEIALATMNLDESNHAKVGDLESEKILERVKKLLSLAQSSNTHEAELATIKANDLLLRHNLKYIENSDESIYLNRILSRKRKDSKLTAIYSILKHFIVRPVISQGQGICCLEVSGSLTNVKLASYVASFLDQEMDFLWTETKKEHQLNGIQAKNSFFIGISEGFEQKMNAAKSAYSIQDKKALIIVEKNLEVATNQIYRRLGQSRSDHQKDNKANSLGKAKGLNLSIKRALEGTSPVPSISYSSKGPKS